MMIPLSSKLPRFAAGFWLKSMQSVGDKATCRLHALNYYWGGADVQWSDGAVLVTGDDGVLVLKTDLKARADFDALLAANEHLRAQYPQGLFITPYSHDSTLYRRAGFRLAVPITCNVYYSDNWFKLADEGQAIDLGAVSA
jgi:hypothetical protein